MTRRSFLSCAALPALAAARRPNIVLILADDLGYSDLGCYGSEIPTPNIDGLARGGVRFTHFYNAARCCPTRAALLTGLYPHQAGVGHMWRDLGAPAYQGRLNDRCATLGEALRAGGYATLLSGKWHVGMERPQWPCDRGFEESYALLASGSNYFRPRPLVKNDVQVQPGGEDYYMTDDLTAQALSMLERHGRGPRPFFLYLAYTAPHFPIQAREEDIRRHLGRYRAGWDEIRRRRHKRMIELGAIDKECPLSPRPADAPAWESAEGKEDWDRRMAVYAAMVERMDRGVGRVLDKLRELGAESNTLVLFLSDNGACAEHKKPGQEGAAIGSADFTGTYELPWANASNTPFRYYKHWAYEGGIATPFIARWPGAIRPGTVEREVGHVIDVMPTLIEIGGGVYPEGRIPLEGRSLATVLRGGRGAGERTLYWEHEGNRAVRRGPWKLVAGYEREWELYHVASDRTESRDLAARQPERVREMTALYESWARRCGVLPWTREWERDYGIPQ